MKHTYNVYSNSIDNFTITNDTGTLYFEDGN